MNRKFKLILFFSLFLIGCRHDSVVPLDPVYFDTQILPVIQSNCAKSGCHDGKGDSHLVLNSYDNIMSSNVISKGNPRKSSLYTTIVAKGSWFARLMPPSPNAPIAIGDIRNIYVWILQGANNNSAPILPCDSLHVTFSSTIKPILDVYCVGCHSGSNPGGNINLSTYDQLINISDTTNNNANNRLLKSILQTGPHPMPPNGKLSDCMIAQFKKWINDGQQND